MIHVAYFIFGAITGIVLTIIYACCAVSSKCSREEEKREWERKLP